MGCLRTRGHLIYAENGKVGCTLKKKNVFGMLLIGVIFAAIMCGCGSSENSEKNENSENKSVTENTEHEAITIMDAQRDYSGLIELVKEKYPEINIEIVPYRGRNMSAYCKQQLETGIMPDIYSTTQAWDGDLQKEYLIDLSTYAVTEKYNSARLSEYAVDGGIYLLPFDYSITGFLCNKSLLERNGISVPVSFAELRDVTIPALKEKGIIVADCLLDLPGSAFQYFFNICSGNLMNTLSGREWREAFIDTNSNTWASDSKKMAACAAYFKEWIDCGMIVKNEYSSDYSACLGHFMEGNTAFLIGTIKRFTQNEDGTGDEYVLMPWLGKNEEDNTYIISPARFYGLNKTLAESGNEQKLQDAIHVLEVLSTYEGYVAINGETSTNMCSINDFDAGADSPYRAALQKISVGHGMNMVYTGWDNYLVAFGEAVVDWISGNGTAETAFKALDNKKTEIRKQGVTYYATVTEELDTVEAAHLSGQMFMEATGADCALISYNVYNPEIHALMENSYGANGHILPGLLTEEYITIFLPTGWYDTLSTVTKTGAEIKEMAASGADTRATGYKYPYVFLTADGKTLEDDKTYTAIVCGYNKSEKATLGLVNTGIVGLDAAKAYLLKVGTVSKETLDKSLLISEGTIN